MRTVFKYAGKYVCVLAVAAAVVSLSGCSLFSWMTSKKVINPPSPLVEFKATQTPRTLWKISLPKSGVYQFSPTVAGDSVYAASADGTIMRINAVSGQTVWRTDAKMKLTAGVGSDGSTVVVAGEKGVVLAYDGAGKFLWKAQATSEILSAPAVGSGLVIVRSLDSRIAAYDALTGERRWLALRNTPSLTLRNAAGIVIASQTAYVALPGGRLAALMLTNGGPRWEAPVGDPRGTTELERISDVSGLPSVSGNTVCAVAFQGRIGCFDAMSGAVHWIKDFSSTVGLGMDESYVFASDERGAVVEFARDSGAVLWRNDKMAYRQLSAPASVGNAVAVGDYQGYIHFLSRETGNLVARVATDGSPIISNPIVVGGSVIFQTQAGSLVALAAE
jgi:outer membrane protein assembly factor BamB